MKRGIHTLTVFLLFAVLIQPAATAAEDAAPVRLVAEWELTGPLVVVWPEHLRRQSALVEPINNWIRSLPKDWDVAVISARPPSIRALQDLGRDVRYLPIDRPRNVFVRDWAGLPAADAEGRLHAAKFRYQPGHLSGGDVARAHDNHRVGAELGESLYGAISEIPLTMSGSAITHNGKDTAIVSQRIIGENEQRSITEIRDRLRRYAGLTQVVFVPLHPDDRHGHLTGLIRFASDDLVLVTDHPDENGEQADFARRLEEQIDRDLGQTLRVKRLPRPSISADLPFEAGSYLDFIALDDHLLVPFFDAPEDEEVLEILSEALPGRVLAPIPADVILPLAREGLAPSRISVVY